MPRKTPTPAAVAPAAAKPTPVSSAGEWGRVSEDGTVEVREGESWRVVGQYPDGTPDEALAYFVRKYDDIAFKVVALEQRATCRSRPRTSSTRPRTPRPSATSPVSVIVSPR